ncbi:Maf family nucleotide pyrophosphatase [Flavobacteriaceae bacterium S356]|uniref:dTTP/UTP pyrophosphatase n=1 Tax=Asprobacillus argus TaxID=3076534 RepID=A0ABU3LE64_9FLAO|nr:Maf family nucleotide pyrophosphatase [Flavobacteriaceae bacterium S356]
MLREKLSEYSIILASGSPRRQQFFKDLDIPFSIQLKEVEEIYPEDLMAEEITDYLARLKSQQFTEIQDNEVVITSDTIVWLNERALGKPKNYNDAFLMLQSLSGRSHDVYTSICIKTKNNEKVISDCTKVYFKELSDKEIHYYLKEYKPFDKAGSYGIQDWIGLIGIDKIEGSYFNVMGLPVHKLYKELMKL